MLLVDVDDFKVVNDSLGHAHRDAVLQRLGRRLAGAVRLVETVARLGGDEFVLVCEDFGTADTRDRPGRPDHHRIGPHPNARLIQKLQVAEGHFDGCSV
ncbi:diguanylate cyclase domain-containing protein [Nocardia xishanensis]